MSGDITIRTHCPLCGGSGKQAFWTKYGGDPRIAGQPVSIGQRPRILTCEICGSRFTTPVVGNDVIRRCYLKADTGVWPDDPRNVVCRDYRNRIQRICHYAITPSVLDIGCYTGEFLAHFPDDWAKAGIELSDSAAAVARQRNIQIIGAEFFETQIEPGTYGVIAAMNIIEHVPDPTALVRKAADSLGDGGILVIETGDVRSWFARLMGEYWSYYHLPEHISFLPRKVLVQMMRRFGLEIIESRSNLFFKRPWGVKGWLWHLREAGYSIGAAVKWRAKHLLVSGSTQPTGVRWLLQRDHMLIIGQKKSAHASGVPQ